MECRKVTLTDVQSEEKKSRIVYIRTLAVLRIQGSIFLKRCFPGIKFHVVSEKRGLNGELLRIRVTIGTVTAVWRWCGWKFETLTTEIDSLTSKTPRNNFSCWLYEFPPRSISMYVKGLRVIKIDNLRFDLRHTCQSILCLYTVLCAKFERNRWFARPPLCKRVGGGGDKTYLLQ